MNRLRFGLDASSASLSHPTGVSKYITHLVGALQDLIHTDESLTLFFKLSRLKDRNSVWRPEGITARGFSKRWWPPAKGIDIFHGLDGGLPGWKNVQKVVTFHDLVVILTQDNEVSPAAFRTKKAAAYREATSSADAIIAVSSRTKDDLVEHLDVPENRVTVISPGVSTAFISPLQRPVDDVLTQYGLTPGYILFVGTLSERKNSRRIVEAYVRSGLSKEMPLVMVGPAGRYAQGTLAAVSAHRLENRVRIIGYVSDDDLPYLYAGAACFAFPTLYEGFGIPLLEAMAVGCRVLSSDTGAAPDVTGGHAIHVDPYQIDAISDGLIRALRLPDETVARAQERAREFTWKAAGKATLDLYRKMALDRI